MFLTHLAADALIAEPQPTHVPVPQHLYAQLQRAVRIANEAVVCDIESNAYPIRSDCGTVTWYDTQPMLDPREHGPEIIDMVSEAIQYGVESGLLIRHQQQPHWLRVARPGR